MALNFVAAEDGLEEDGALLKIGRLLKVDTPLAFWFVLRWRRFVLNYGDHQTGQIAKRYDSDDLAAFLRWNGPAARLIDALKAAGLLTFTKGRGFRYVDWPSTVTGQYAQRRDKDKKRKEEEREERRGAKGQGVDSPRTVQGQGVDVSTDSPRTGVGNPRERKKERNDAPPGGSPPQGGSQGATRVEWMEANYPLGLVKPDECVALLSEMDEAEWGRVQWAVLNGYLKKNPRFVPQAERMLQKRLYRLFKPPRPSKQNGHNGHAKPAVESKADKRKRLDEEQRAEQAAEDAKRLLEIKARLRAEGLRGSELNDRAMNELEQARAN